MPVWVKDRAGFGVYETTGFRLVFDTCWLIKSYPLEIEINRFSHLEDAKEAMAKLVNEISKENQVVEV